MDDKARKLRESVQSDIVGLIKKKMEKGEISEARAKEIANMVLQKLPKDISYEALMQVIPTLDDHFEELATVVLPIMTEYEAKMRAAVDQKISQLMQQGKFDQALNIAKKAIEHEKNLA